MNKQERKLKKFYKFKKRIKLLIKKGIKNITITHSKNSNVPFNCYRTTGKPCSCYMCSPGKLGEKDKYKEKHKKNIKFEWNEEW